MSCVRDLSASKEAREAEYTEQLLSKKLIKSNVHEEREYLNTKRHVDRDRAEQIVARIHERIACERTRVEVYIVHDVIDRERKIEEQKVRIIGHHSDRKLILLAAQRVLFECRSTVLEQLSNHQPIEHNH